MKISLLLIPTSDQSVVSVQVKITQLFFKIIKYEVK